MFNKRIKLTLVCLQLFILYCSVTLTITKTIISLPHHTPKVQHVSFHPHVTVYPVNDCYRTATLTYIALDGVTFQRTIERTKLIVLPI